MGDSGSTPRPENLENLTREELASCLEQESHNHTAWMLVFHQAVADSLGLNDTDHRCLDIILKGPSIFGSGPITPSQLAKQCRLTSGAVTGVLDRLERAGFVKRVHDPEDRRRIIIQPTMDKVQTDVVPNMAWLQAEWSKLCGGYSEEQLLLLIGFLRESQRILQEATKRLRKEPVAPGELWPADDVDLHGGAD